MKKHQRKMYLVHREVFATSMKSALNGKGTVYSIEVAEEKHHPLPEKEQVGFISKTNGKKK